MTVKVGKIWLREEDLALYEVNSRMDGKGDIPHVFNTESFLAIIELKRSTRAKQNDALNYVAK